jgi:hypothetical protein
MHLDGRLQDRRCHLVDPAPPTPWRSWRFTPLYRLSC